MLTNGVIGATFYPHGSYAVRGHLMTTGALDMMTIDKIGRRKYGEGTLTFKGQYENHGNCGIPIFQSSYTMECAELPLHALLQLACGKKVTYCY